MKNSILFDVDSYKASHYLQYPEGTTSMFSYIESRAGGEYSETLFFGLQYYLKEYLSTTITIEDVEDAKEFFALHGEPFNYDGWMYIAKDLEGKLPIRIRAVPEGTVVPTNNILVSVESTDPKVFWIVSWIESMLLRIWYPITISTRSYTIKKIIMEALNKSADKPESKIAFALNDFGARGVSSRESSMIGGMAHLVNFMGSDNVAAIRAAKTYYGANMAGFSIPAAEHSSITSWGKEAEIDAYRNMLQKFAKPNSMVAIVSDSYDLWNALENIFGRELKQEIIDSGATVILRPDSGIPEEVVIKSLKILDNKFGHTINSKGFKVLKNVKLIQGDGVSEKSIKNILDIIVANGFSAENVAFGCGGELLQKMDRDTLRFAMKCSHISIGNKQVDVFKCPATDTTKSSKKGRLDLILENGEYKTIRLDKNQISAENSVMRTVYENGQILIKDNFETIRNRNKL